MQRCRPRGLGRRSRGGPVQRECKGVQWHFWPFNCAECSRPPSLKRRRRHCRADGQRLRARKTRDAQWGASCDDSALRGFPVTLSELRNAWTQRRDEWRRFGVQVDGAKLCEAILNDLDELADGDVDELLTLTAAAAEKGSHPDSIGRAVRDGRLRNYGRRNAPRVRRGDLASLGGSRSERKATLTN